MDRGECGDAAGKKLYYPLAKRTKVAMPWKCDRIVRIVPDGARSMGAPVAGPAIAGLRVEQTTMEWLDVSGLMSRPCRTLRHASQGAHDAA